jgi:regulator of protease activity HflC (stomatin/prohibitin superfamily)
MVGVTKTARGLKREFSVGGTQFSSGIHDRHSGDVDENALEIKPLAAEADFASLVKHLVDPVVIMNRGGRICFMNPRAERMLGGGLKERLEAHLNSQPQQSAISQVRFRLDGGAELILKIRLSGMKWMGEEATQVSLKDVTAYVTSAQRSALEVEETRGKLEKAQKERQQFEQQAAEARQEAAEALRVREQSAAQLQKEAAERAAAQAEAQRLREENEKLRQKIAAALQAERVSSEAQEWPDESDPLRFGKVEKASAKRRRELESNGAAGAT